MKHLIFLLISLSLVACTKFGRTHTAKGKVINPITGEGIPNAQMKILKHTLGLPGGLKSVKEATSDADGNYEISKSGLNSYSLRCELASDYYKIGWYDNGEKIATASSDLALKMGKTKNVDYYAVPYGEMTLTINNINCLGPADSMQFCKKYQFDDTFESYSTYRLGCYYYNSEPFLVPIGSYIFKTKVTRNNLITYVYDTVLVSKSGIAHIQIDY